MTQIYKMIIQVMYTQSTAPTHIELSIICVTAPSGDTLETNSSIKNPDVQQYISITKNVLI